mmetsp:Transcript_18441/g.53579  ORF Transcript_18441/g.53579 Transcript_18441/m.53579 type:complete len:392 (-) Transcript_18441:73-1248(-)
MCAMALPAAAFGTMPAGVSPLSPAAAAVEPKGALNHFCQRFCRRPVTKSDIIYTSAKYGKVYQVTVTLHCIEGQQFVGETAATLKDAEKNAAQQALIHFEPLTDSLPPTVNSKNKNNKRKSPAMPGYGMMPGMGALPDAAYQMQALDGELGQPAAKMFRGPDGSAMALASGLPQPLTVAPDNPALTSKVMLNTACMKLLRRPLQKGEILYETVQTPLGYQSTVRLPCLPGELGLLTWAGEVAPQQKQAEQNSARQALEAITTNGEALGLQMPPPGEPKAKQQKGKGKGWGKGWGWNGCGGGGCGAPPRGPLPRQRVTEVAITGEVLDWKGSYGWVTPHTEIQHAMAMKRGGRIFLSKADVGPELQLGLGTVLQFHVYEDASGLGAEEVQAF